MLLVIIKQMQIPEGILLRALAFDCGHC